MLRRLLLFGCFLVLLLPACQEPGAGRLTVVFPPENTELSGLQLLRVVLNLRDRDGQPVEGASVQAELRAPTGDVFATLDCTDKGQGRYLADDYVQLPLRGSQGTWRVVARATWGDGQQAQAERDFKGLPSLSEEIQNEFGFWIDVPKPKGYGYNRLWHYAQRNDDGSGYVFIDNPGHGSQRADTHWRHADWPANEAAARAYVRDLPLSAERDLIPDPKLVAEQTTFQERPAWLVTGRTVSNQGYNRPPSRLIEWVIFQCPDSPWLWTLAIHTKNPTYVEHLRTTRETFECPASQ